MRPGTGCPILEPMVDDRDAAPADDAPTGRVWIDEQDPRVLRLAGEVDQPVVRRARERITDHDLGLVDVVDLAEVTFVDSSLISLVANLTLGRRPDAEPLTLRRVPELARFVMDVSGLTSAVKILD